MTVLVTGGTGFLGRPALPLLIARGEAVVVASRRRPVDLPPSVQWAPVDLLDAPAMGALVRAVRPDALLHLAWYVEHGKFWHAPANLDWLAASCHLVRTFVEQGGRRVVVAGTCAEYTWGDEAPCHEWTTPTVPGTLYGTAKLALFHTLSAFAAVSGLSLAWGRIFLPYGPGEPPKRLVASTIRSLLAGQPALCTHGEQRRDLIFVDDVASALVALLQSDVTGPVNLGSGQPVRLSEVVLTIARQLDRPELIRLGALPTPPDDPPVLIPDVRRLQQEVGWRASITLDEGIARSIAWWRQHPEAAGASYWPPSRENKGN